MTDTEKVLDDLAMIDRQEAELAGLRAEIARLREELAQSAAAYREASASYADAAHGLAEAMTENARLRAALEKIAAWGTAWPENDPGYASTAVVTAREAVPQQTPPAP